MADELDEPGPSSRVGRSASALGAAAVAVAIGVGGFGAAGPARVGVGDRGGRPPSIALSRVPAAPEPRRRHRPGPPVDNAPFRSYRQVAEALSWADVSPRHYDLVTRPLLVRVLTTRLADRHRIDLATDPDAARRLVGDDVWHWLDPDREVSRQGQPPGVDQATLTRIVDRLENL